jgi:uncharacterized protein YecT (DUF1311 family)
MCSGVRLLGEKGTMHRLLLFALLATPLFAQTSECAKIEGTAQASRCYSKELAQAEADMKAAYEKMLAYYAPTTDKLHGLRGAEREEQGRWYIRMQRQIRASQRAFLRFRESTCAIQDIEWDGGTIHAIAAPACRWELTRQRAKWLVANLQEEGG